MNKLKYIAFCTKGLEHIAEDEIKHTCSNAVITTRIPKRIIFTTRENIAQLVKLKTLDDIGMLLADFEHNGNLDTILQKISQIDFLKAQNIIRNFRNIHKKIFSITCSAIGIERNVKDKLLYNITNVIHKRYHWKLQKKDHTHFDIRIFIDKKLVQISIRLTKNPLYYRDYRLASQPGALRPSIAAAMVYAVTQYKKNLSVVDNCCGSGTILCEALLQNYSIYGGDIDPQSVKIAKKNIDSINSKAVQHIKQLDCQKSPWQSQFFDCAISNLPYGKQVTVDHQTTLYAKTVEEYARIIKPKGSICLLGTHPEVIQKYAKKYLPNHKCKFFALGFLGQTPYLSCIHPK